MSKAEWNLEVKEGNVNKKNRKEELLWQNSKNNVPFGQCLWAYLFDHAERKDDLPSQERFFIMRTMSFAKNTNMSYPGHKQT